VLCWKDNEKNGYLTNWARSLFRIAGVEYTSCEQWIMANKALLCGDEAVHDQIMATQEPSEQKRLGRTLDLSKKAWNATAKWEVQLEGARTKFRQNHKLACRLLCTGSKPIAEASPSDSIFGIGIAPNDPRAQDVANWKGGNILGRALMQVRQELREEILAQNHEAEGAPTTEAHSGAQASSPASAAQRTTSCCEEDSENATCVPNKVVRPDLPHQ